MNGVQLEPETQPVAVTANADGGNVIITPEKSSVEIIADAKQVCVDPDGQPTIEVSPQTQVVAVTASVEPAQPVAVQVGQASVNVTASALGIQGPPGPPGPTRTVTFVTPTEFLQNSEFAYFGWEQWPNPGDGWRVLRVKVATPYTRVKATVANNPAFVDFATAWNDRAILNFQAG